MFAPPTAFIERFDARPHLEFRSPFQEEFLVTGKEERPPCFSTVRAYNQSRLEVSRDEKTNKSDRDAAKSNEDAPFQVFHSIFPVGERESSASGSRRVMLTDSRVGQNQLLNSS